MSLLLLDLLFIKGVSLDNIPDKLSPSCETGAIEHFGQEEVDWLGIESLEESALKVVGIHLALLAFNSTIQVNLVLLGDSSKLELSHEFSDDHQSIHFGLRVSDILSSHNSVEHLVEVDKSVIHINAHLENDSVDLLFLRIVFFDTNLPPHFSGELIEELVDILDLHADALVGTSEEFPGVLEVDKVILKARQRVVGGQIVLIELLDDDKDEQIEHDLTNNHIESEEEDRCDG